MVLALVLMSSCAFAPEPTLFGSNGSEEGNADVNVTMQGSGQDIEQISESGNASSDQDDKGEPGQAGMDADSAKQTGTGVQARDASELREMIQQKQQDMSQEMSGLDEKQQKIYQNQNKVRTAVHSLLAMEGLAGNKGARISEIAREFDNSVQATIRSEEKIESKGSLSRMLTGGDAEAAGELERQTIQNREKIQELNQLKNECDCDSEVKAMMQEQINNMEQEQARLEQLAQSEKQSKGLIGWLWK
ncbi:MAG: hypothetical protein KAS11_00670 [Candidatus Aenigmarchaeota archaeon]|nr:hypothetical protein [Candidatus Aenigmarchaeota archaeon]